MTRTRLEDGAWIDYQDQRWHLERRQGADIEWRCRRTLTHMVWTDAELQKRIGLGEVRLCDGVGREPRDGKTSRVHGARKASDLDNEEARRKMIYVLAIRAEAERKAADSEDDGEGMGPADWQAVIDAVYEDQGRTWKRLRSRTHEVVAKPVIRSVQNWVRDAGDPPRQDRLVPRHRHKGNYDDRIETDLRELIAVHVDEHWLKRPPIRFDDLKTLILGAMPALNAERQAKGRSALPAPGDKAIQSGIDAVPKDTVLRARYGDMRAFLRYGSAEAQPDPEKALDRVEIDATRMDLFVVDPDTLLPIGRPWLVVALDRCTRMVLGWFVTFEPPSILALMQCLRSAILSKDYVEELKAERGWVIHNTPETFGVPRVVALDRARENISEHVSRFAARIGINRIELMAGRRPWLKGAVERVIKTISERLLHPARGTTFHNVLMRMDYDPLKDAVCTPDDLDYALHKFFIDVYPFEERRSLNGRQAIKVWREKTAKTPVDSVGHIDDVAHLFGRTDAAVPGRHGINANSMQYFSRELLDVQRNPQFQKALAKQGGRIEYHLDPAHIYAIHVRLPHKAGAVITVPVARKWTEYATGLSLWHHRAIRAYIRADARTDAPALLKAKLELMAIMRGSALARKGGLRARSIGARMEGVQRLAPAGSSSANTVPGSDAHRSAIARRRGRSVPAASNDTTASDTTKTTMRLVVDHDAHADEAANHINASAEGRPARSRRPREGWTP